MSGRRVQDHYANSDTGAGLAARIIEALRTGAGANVAITPDTLAPFDHYLGGGVAATQNLAALLEPRAGETIVDIGCGIGGPARWIAAKYACMMTGVDLTAEFCEAAMELNELTGMSDVVRILEGSALGLPLPGAGFDRAYSSMWR